MVWGICDQCRFCHSVSRDQMRDRSNSYYLVWSLLKWEDAQDTVRAHVNQPRRPRKADRKCIQTVTQRVRSN